MRLILDQDAEEREVRRALTASVQAAIENDYEPGKDQYAAALRLAKIHQAQIDLLYGNTVGEGTAKPDDGWGSAPQVDQAEATTTTKNTDGSTTTETRRVTRVAPMAGSPHELRRDPEWLARMAMVRTLLTSGEAVTRIVTATGISAPTIRKERDRMRETERGKRRRQEQRAARVAPIAIIGGEDDGFE